MASSVYELYGGVMGDGPLRSFDDCPEAHLGRRNGWIWVEGDGGKTYPK